jgi:hypothetical protein
MILTCNDQPTAPDSLNPTAKWGTMPIIFNNEMTILPYPWDISSIGWMKIDFPVYSNTILSPVIDKYRVGVVAIVDTITEGSASSSMESELIGAAGASSIACRYVSKRIEMTSSGNDIAVFLKAFGGKADGLIRVFVKTDSGGTGWDDDNNYIELFPHSDPNTRPDGSERTTMNSFKEYCFRPPNVWPNNPLQNFTTYSVKVVMMKSTDIDHPDKHDELPYVQDLRAVPMNSTA